MRTSIIEVGRCLVMELLSFKMGTNYPAAMVVSKESIEVFFQQDCYKALAEQILGPLDKSKSKRKCGPTLTYVLELLANAKAQSRVGLPLEGSAGDDNNTRSASEATVFLETQHCFTEDIMSSWCHMDVDIIVDLCRHSFESMSNECRSSVEFLSN